MKSIISLCLVFCLTSPLLAEGLSDVQKETESLYRTGAGSEDSTFTAISTSMLGWGTGLALGIGILASVLHQSAGSHTHSENTSSSN